MTASQFATPPKGLAKPISERRARVRSLPLGQALEHVRDAARNAALGAALPARRRAFAMSEAGSSSDAILTDLNDSQSGATGLIVCNGPSLNSTDMSLIGDRPYILMNRGYLLGERLPHEPVALGVSARPVLEQYGAEIEKLNTTLLLSAEHKELISRRDRVAFTLADHRWRFATKIGDSLHPGYTVTFLALQLAFHLGWQKTIIIGMDHRYDRTGDPSVVETLSGPDANHFDPNYFQHGATWILPALQMNEYSYRLARSAFEDAGRVVLDATVNGACPVFERSSLEVALR